MASSMKLTNYSLLSSNTYSQIAQISNADVQDQIQVSKCLGFENGGLSSFGEGNKHQPPGADLWNQKV